MRSSYYEDDVTLLLKDITGLVEPIATEEREKYIQSGTHYSEMLPLEYKPTDKYIERCLYLKELIDDLKPEYDYIIIDCPAGIEHGFKNAIAAAERAIIVTTPEVSAIRDADRIIGILNSCEMPRIDLVINKIRMNMVRRGDMMSVDDVVDILSVNLIGTIMDDEAIVISTNRGEMVAGTRTKSGKSYNYIAKRIAGETTENAYEDYSLSIFKLLKKKDKNVHKIQSQGL